MLGHDAVAADAAHKVDGSTPALTGGVCERTPQVRDALVAHAQGRDAAGDGLLEGDGDPSRRGQAPESGRSGA